MNDNETYSVSALHPLYNATIWACTHTCTQLTHVAHHSNVIMMTTVLQWSFNFVVRALLQLFLFATAGHIGQPDLATSGAIVARIH